MLLSFNFFFLWRLRLSCKKFGKRKVTYINPLRSSFLPVNNDERKPPTSKLTMTNWSFFGCSVVNQIDEKIGFLDRNFLEPEERELGKELGKLVKVDITIRGLGQSSQVVFSPDLEIFLGIYGIQEMQYQDVVLTNSLLARGINIHSRDQSLGLKSFGMGQKVSIISEDYLENLDELGVDE